MPYDWTGDCTMGYLAPPLQTFLTDSMTGIVRGVWRKFNKWGVSNLLFRYKTGYHSSTRALILSLGCITAGTGYSEYFSRNVGNIKFNC